jgi:isopenicillin N synthase-like dioxygenase
MEQKSVFRYNNFSDGIGYECKDGTGKKADLKENFDVTFTTETWLERYKKILSPDAYRFVVLANNLTRITKPILLKFAKNIEHTFDLPGFSNEVDQSEDSYFFRFIHYFGDRENGGELASAHADQSGFTLHLYESAPGLERLTYNGRWKKMPVSRGKTAIIPAMQLQLRSHGLLRATCHRVVATKSTAKHGRFSAVCFIQLKNTPKYDKATFGRLQEKIPGFNYEMPFTEFSELFK